MGEACTGGVRDSARPHRAYVPPGIAYVTAHSPDCLRATHRDSHTTPQITVLTCMHLASLTALARCSFYNGADDEKEMRYAR